MDSPSPPRRNIVSLTAVQAMRFSASLVVSVLLARGLGVTAYGQYATILTAAHLLGFMANLGIHQLLPRAVARAAPTDQRAWMRSALRATGLGSLVAAAVLALGGWWRGADWLLPAFIAGLALGGMSLVNVYMAVFEGIRRMQLQLPGVALGRSVVVVGTVAVLAAGGELASVFAVQLFAWAATGVVFAVTAHRTLPASRDTLPTSDVVRQAVPFAGFILFAAVQERVDVLVLDLYHSSETVGLYRAATVFLISVPVVARIIATAAYPALAAAWTRGEDIAPLLQRMYRLALATGLAFSVGASTVGPDLLVAVLGEPYAAAGPLLVMGSWLLPLTFVRITLALSLLAVDRERWRSLGMGSIALLNVALNLIVVPTHGAPGAIVTTLVCEAVLVIAFHVPLRRYLGWSFVATAYRAATAAAVLGLATLVIPNPWLGAFIGSAAWVAVAYLTGAWSPNDVKALARL